MDGSSIEDRVFEVVKHVQPVEELTEETEFASLGWDSLDYMELLTELEEEFNINVSDTDVEGFATVGELVDFVEGKV